MSSKLPLLCLIHFLLLGIILGRRKSPFTPTSIMLLFSYLVVVHAALAFMLIIFPKMIDPRVP